MHKTINLQLRKQTSGVYGFIRAWEPVKSNHAKDVYYLLLHATVKWGTKPEREAFLIAMQYSKLPGQNVDVSQPAHIVAEDIEVLHEKWSTFIRQRRGKD